MKRILIILAVAISVLNAVADTPFDMQQWVKDLQWESPKRTGIKEIDNLYDQADQLYLSVKHMADSVPVYSMRSIVENGDTVAILVVNQFYEPYDSWSAAEQWVTASKFLKEITDEAADLAGKYKQAGSNVTQIFKKLGFKAIPAGKDFTKVSGKVGKITKDFIPNMKKLYAQRGNPINDYQKASSKMTPEEGFVNTGFDHVPEFDPDNMPTDEELDKILALEREHRGE